jgi:hypothetical protein
MIEDLDTLVRRLFVGDFEPSQRPGVMLWIKSHDIVAALGGNTYLANFERIEVQDDKLYRVVIRDGRVEVICFGIDLLDPQAEGEYDSVDDLPKWVQDRLAVLMITSAKPPTTEVEGVGRRIDDDVYWVYAE